MKTSRVVYSIDSMKRAFNFKVGIKGEMVSSDLRIIR